MRAPGLLTAPALFPLPFRSCRWGYAGETSGTLTTSTFEERDQLLRHLFRSLLGQIVSRRQRPAPHIGSVFAPDFQHVVESLHDTLLPPECQKRAPYLTAPVGLVVVEVYGGCGPVVFAHRVNGLRVAEVALVLGVGFGGEHLRARPIPAECLAEEVIRLGPEQALRQVVGLDQEEPMIVSGGEILADRC